MTVLKYIIFILTLLFCIQLIYSVRCFYCSINFQIGHDTSCATPGYSFCYGLDAVCIKLVSNNSVYKACVRGKDRDHLEKLCTASKKISSRNCYLCWTDLCNSAYKFKLGMIFWIFLILFWI